MPHSSTTVLVQRATIIFDKGDTGVGKNTVRVNVMVYLPMVKVSFFRLKPN